MHEMSIAMAVVCQVEEAARTHGAAGVETVTLQVGELAGVVPEALRFSFALACEGTVLSGAELVADQVPGRARCTSCAREWETGLPPRLGCPRCADSRTELLSGRELQIATVRWAEDPQRTRALEEL
ncbi:hydrogenase maturation nickel metallochaperone HypA [Streptomyces qinglanensis]|uniref:hydrogenase maturation nickel metallochaperone HypA n=1 Tax=Streptomyces qinglanensis TaxID=943816 RepID=UPI003D7080A7